MAAAATATTTAGVPMDIVYDLLINQPVKSLLRFKCVCKAWHDMIASSDFIKSHLDRSIRTNSNGSFIPTDFCNSLHQFHGRHTPTKLNFPKSFRYKGRSQAISQVIGSCNGLICAMWGPTGLILCNPSTRNFQIVPLPHDHGDDGIIMDRKSFVNYGYGFGYDSKSDDYKIVKILLSNRVLVYSLRANSWSQPQSPDTYGSFDYFGQNKGTFLNNHLHWVYNGRLYTFDLHDYTWGRVLRLPNNAAFDRLGVFDGCLYLSQCDVSNVFHIWVMREYGVEDSWTYFSPFLYNRNMIKPLACCKGSTLFRYNSNNETIQELKVFGLIGLAARGVNCFKEVNFCVESLVPLMGNDQLIEGDTMDKSKEKYTSRKRKK